jgi:hypothetical protein
MASKMLSLCVGVLVIGCLPQVASAQWGGCYSWSPGYSYGYGGGGWQGYSYYQPAPAQTMTYQQAPSQVPPAPAPPAGQTAQSNNQTYQSFSAEPQATGTYAAPAPTYSYPAYGGYYGNGFYGGGYGGGYYGNTTNSQWDNANYHGINPNAYP